MVCFLLKTLISLMSFSCPAECSRNIIKGPGSKWWLFFHERMGFLLRITANYFVLPAVSLNGLLGLHFIFSEQQWGITGPVSHKAEISLCPWHLDWIQVYLSDLAKTSLFNGAYSAYGHCCLAWHLKHLRDPQVLWSTVLHLFRTIEAY